MKIYNIIETVILHNEDGDHIQKKGILKRVTACRSGALGIYHAMAHVAAHKVAELTDVNKRHLKIATPEDESLIDITDCGPDWAPLVTYRYTFSRPDNTKII